MNTRAMRALLQSFRQPRARLRRQNDVKRGAAARGAKQVVRGHEATGARAAAVHGGEAAANETTADAGAVRGLTETMDERRARWFAV